MKGDGTLMELIEKEVFTKGERRAIHSLFFSQWENYKVEASILEKHKNDKNLDELLTLYTKIYGNRAYVLSHSVDTQVPYYGYTPERYPMIGLNVLDEDFIDILEDFIISKERVYYELTKYDRRIRKSDKADTRWRITINRSAAKDVSRDLSLLEKILKNLKV